MGPFWVLLPDLLPAKYRVPLVPCSRATLAIAVLLLLGGLIAVLPVRFNAKHKD
jgi:hypothetical protein